LAAGPINVAHAQVGGFGQAQTAGIDRHEKGPVTRLGGSSEQSLDFTGGIDLGAAGIAFHAREGGQERAGVPSQDGGVEEAHGMDREVHAGGRQLAVLDQVLDPDSDLLVGDSVGRTLIEAGQIGDEGGVGLLGTNGPAPNGQAPNIFCS
jgi:hypothetical protein